MAIIKSLLDVDFYKFTMLQAFFHKLRNNTGHYKFANRSTSVDISLIYDDLLKELDHLCSLTFSMDEIQYLREQAVFEEDFLEYLTSFKLNRNMIVVSKNPFTIETVKNAPQLDSSMFEIYVLAIVNELYFKKAYPNLTLDVARVNLKQKIEFINSTVFDKKTPYEFFDFGTRRRFSREWHDEVVSTLVAEVPEYFKGTSNVLLAKKYGIKVIGTMAHEYLQTYQRAPNVPLRDFQKKAFYDWLDEYKGKLAIALTDVITMDAFLTDFNKDLADKYAGMRHDSNCPYEWGDKAVAFYKNLGIDPLTKTLIFSDSLTVPKSISLYEKFGDVIKTGSGIGTNLTNDVGVPSINIVMKLVDCNGQPTAKISDAKGGGKTMTSDLNFVRNLKELFNVPA